MTGGGHHEPPVFTHFFPGMMAGIVLGGVVGTLLVARLAAGSVQEFWERTRPVQGQARACATLAGVHASEESAGGAAYSVLSVGGGNDIILTVSNDMLRAVPVASGAVAYLTVVQDEAQGAAFPAHALYRVDLCSQTITRILGGNEETLTVLGISASGAWVLYKNDNGLFIMLTDEHRVIALDEQETPTSAVFSLHDDAVTLTFASGRQEVWTHADDANTLTRHTIEGGGNVLPWGLHTAQEYLANIK